MLSSGKKSHDLAGNRIPNCPACRLVPILTELSWLARSRRSLLVAKWHVSPRNRPKYQKHTVQGSWWFGRELTATVLYIDQWHAVVGTVTIVPVKQKVGKFE